MPQTSAARKARYQQRDKLGVCCNCGRSRDGGNKLCSRCSKTSRKASEKWKGKQTDYDKKKALRRKYGLTVEDWDRLLAAQDGRCAVCRTDKPVTGGWQVDHCHATNRVRALLCRLCNVGLGSFKDDPQLLENAAAYLRKHRLLLVG